MTKCNVKFNGDLHIFLAFAVLLIFNSCFQCEQLKLKLKQAEDARKSTAVSLHASPGKMPAEFLLKRLAFLKEHTIFVPCTT